MEIENLWTKTGNKETDDINTIKSWLCGSTDGQTYSIPFRVDVDKITSLGYIYEYPECEFDKIVGFKHDYKIDDPTLEGKAREIYFKLKELTVDIENNPEKYFPQAKDPQKLYVVCAAFRGISCDYCLGTNNRCTNEGKCPFKVVQ